MGRTIYIDPINGSDANSNTGESESTPRKTRIASLADGDWIRFKRGTTYNHTGQIWSSTAQGIIISDYGNPVAPKPIISANNVVSSAAMNMGGDLIVANVEFADIQKSSSETTDSTVGPTCLALNGRGNTTGTVEGVSLVAINVDFKRIGNNAIAFNNSSVDGSKYLLGSPIAIVLGCTFDGTGGDAIYGSIRDYLEVGYCNFRDMGNRIDSSISPPAGGRASGADAVGLLGSIPSLSWIHDNYMDHSDWDCKQIIMLDAPAAQANNLAIIERNIMIGFHARLGQAFQTAYFNGGINTGVRSIIRQNYVRGSRTLINILAQAAGSEIYSNIMDITGASGTDPLVAIFAHNVGIHHNSMVSQQRVIAKAIGRAQNVNRLAIHSNLFANIATAVSLDGGIGSTDVQYGRNAFQNVTSRYLFGSTALADGVGDVQGEKLIDPVTFKIRDDRLLLKTTDRRVPDFWGRFSSDGVGYIGACLNS